MIKKDIFLKLTSRLLLVSFFISLLFQQIQALPGQNINNVVQWSANHTIISKLNLITKYEPDEADYIAQGRFDDGNLSFYIWLEDDRREIKMETIDYRNNITMIFERNNHNATILITHFYNKTIAEDFNNATHYKKIHQSNYITDYYKGKKYSYSTMNDFNNHIYHFTIYKLNRVLN